MPNSEMVPVDISISDDGLEVLRAGIRESRIENIEGLVVISTLRSLIARIDALSAQVKALQAELKAAEEERDEEREAHDRIATLCHSAGIDNPDGTSVGVVTAALAKLAAALEENAALKASAQA